MQIRKCGTGRLLYESGNGETFTFQNFPKEQSYDDIYTINATLTDMAGNESNATVTFSVNRFGSVYVFDQTLKDIEGTYIQNEIDVKLQEVNVDSLEHDKIKVVVDTNGTPRTLEEGIDYQVQESGETDSGISMITPSTSLFLPGMDVTL